LSAEVPARVDGARVQRDSALPACFTRDDPSLAAPEVAAFAKGLCQ
jgi:hypothetical protein